MIDTYPPEGTRVERISDGATGTLLAYRGDKSGDPAVVVHLDSGQEIAGAPWAFRKI